MRVSPNNSSRHEEVVADVPTLRSGFATARRELASGRSVVSLVQESLARAEAAAEQGIFTALVAVQQVLGRAQELAQAAQRGDHLPLLGLTFSVKDNIHVRGMETTSNCPALSISPEESAPVVTALEKAGAVLMGKNTMDQFATGLNGTRSPLPLCRNAIDPAYIPGGSSSGSAVAVARGLVNFSLGSDTGGSGRVPAACNGIVGVKPTIGLVSSRGLVYNSRFFDCIPVFAQSLADANEILECIAGYDGRDPFSRRDADQIETSPTAATTNRLAIPRASQLRFFGDASSEAAYQENLLHLQELGFSLTEIDFAPFEEAGRLVFESAMVAERTIDYADVLASHPEAIHSAVRAALSPSAAFSAADAFKAVYRMYELRRHAADVLASFAAMVVPTVPTIFTIDEMLAEPIALNTIMGTYTYFVNPMDLCAISVPGVKRRDGMPSALQFAGMAGQDGKIAWLAARFADAL